MASRRRLLLHSIWPRTNGWAQVVLGLLASILIPSVHALSHPAQYVTTVWQTEQGLPNNTIDAMVQDNEGYLWAATNAGLARFDGVRFRVFAAEDFPSLQSSRFQSLYASRSGELWIGTRNGGLIRLHDGSVTTYMERDGLPSKNIRSIREDAEGKLWINTISGVACCAGAKLQPVTAYRGKPVSEFFLQARDASMWFRSGTDVVRFGADGSIATLAGGSMAAEARDGSVWIAFQSQSRLVRYHQGAFSEIALPSAGLRQWTAADPWQGVAMEGNPRQAVLGMATDTDGELLLLTAAGLIRVVDGKLGPPEALPLPANSDAPPRVLSLLVDRQGNRWVGTVGRGMFRFRPAPLTAYGKDEGLSDAPFRAVFQDREARIWLGGDDGIYWFDGNTFNRVPGLAQIGTITQTNDGDLWFGGAGSVYRWRSGVVTRFSIDSSAVFQMFQDREGTLWAVAPMREQKWQLHRFRDGKFEQADADAVNVVEDRGGGLWIAGVNPPAIRLVRGGKTILRYDVSSGMPPNGVHSFWQDPNGAFWFSTATGLYRLRDGKFAAITARKGLTTEITSILDDGAGNLWLPSEHGIFRLSLQELNDLADGKLPSIPPISYGIAEGMKNTECNGGAPGSLKARDGRLWFPTMRGVVAVDPNVVTGPPPVVLEDAWAKKAKLGRNDRTSVTAGNDTFDFTFTALDLSAPDRLRFRYRLVPYDKEWVDAGTRRTAHYTNMPPGEYSFEVIAANSFGVWSNHAAGVRFVLQPHYYQTNWFRALCVFLFLALLWAFYELRVRKLQHQFELRKRADEERRQSAERFRAIADYTYDWENWFGVDGKLLWVNPAVERITGYSVTECMAMPDFPVPIVADADRDAVARELAQAVQGSSTNDFEFRVRHKHGSLAWVAASWQPIYDSQGARLGYRASLRDIGKRKQAEEALQQSEAYLAEAQRLSHSGSWALDLANGMYDYISEEDFRIFGLDQQDGSPSRETVFQRIHPDDRSRVEQNLKTTVRDKVDTHDEYRIVLPDGTVKHIFTIRHPILDDAGNVVRLVGTSADITERKRAEEALQRTTTYLGDAHRLTHTGAWAVDTSMEPLYWSEEVFRVFGFDPQQGLPTALQMLQRVHPDDREEAIRTFGRAMKGKVDDEIEFRTVLPDASVKHLHVLGRPVLDDHGEVVEVVGTVVDITERKRAEEALRENEVRFRTFVDHAADALFILDFEQGTIVDVNQSACDTLGYTRQELIGSVPHFFHLDSYRAEVGSVAERAAQGETLFDTHLHRRKDGTTFPVEVSTSSFWHGGRRFLLKLARDISDRVRAEEAIRQSEKQLREAIDTIPANVWSAQPDGTVEFINRRILEFSGLPFEQAIGNGWRDAIHPDDRAPYLNVQDAAVAAGKDFEVEARLLRADGEYRWMLFRSVPLRDETGTVVKRYGVSTDIDDRKRAEQALKRSEAYLSEGQRLSHTGSWAWDPASRQSLYWSEEMLRIFGFDPNNSAPSAEVFWKRIHPDDFERTYELLVKAADGNMDYEHEHRIVLPDGTVKHIHAIGHPVLGNNGVVVEYVGTAVDVTDRKRSEQALRRIEGYLAEAQRLTHTGAWATDATPTPLYWSEELFRLYGFDPKQGIPKHEQAVQCVHPEDRQRYERAFRKILDQKVDSDVEFRTVLPDGTIRWLYGLGHPVLNASGDVVEIVGTTVDITERKRAEEERTRLRHLEADLAHINRVSMLGELTASIAHEVNQPLAGIVGNASAGLRWLAADVPNLDEAREGLRRIVRDGKRAAEVISRTRALTKKTVAQTEKVDVNDTISQVLALVTDEAKRRSVAIETRFAEDLSPVLGDRVQLQQVTLNLVMNAIEAMASASERQLVITTQNGEADRIQVMVEDSGVGLDPKALSKIFDPFYTTKPDGMGMGLSISTSIIQAHGGRLWATTKTSPGTVFCFTLPRYEEQGAPAGAGGV